MHRRHPERPFRDRLWKRWSTRAKKFCKADSYLFAEVRNWKVLTMVLLQTPDGDSAGMGLTSHCFHRRFVSLWHLLKKKFLEPLHNKAGFAGRLCPQAWPLCRFSSGSPNETRGTRRLEPEPSTSWERTAGDFRTGSDRWTGQDDNAAGKCHIRSLNLNYLRWGTFSTPEAQTGTHKLPSKT